MHPSTTVNIGSYTLDTRIKSLGKASVVSPMPTASLLEEEWIPLFLDNEHMEELNGLPAVALNFEKAGPRPKLYFDPSKTKCAVVTCGGLCPGINDVIRAIVMEAHHKYHIPTVIGIKYGL